MDKTYIINKIDELERELTKYKKLLSNKSILENVKNWKYAIVTNYRGFIIVENINMITINSINKKQPVMRVVAVKKADKDKIKADIKIYADDINYFWGLSTGETIALEYSYMIEDLRG